jgi:hypothetical protein
MFINDAKIRKNNIKLIRWAFLSVNGYFLSVIRFWKSQLLTTLRLYDKSVLSTYYTKILAIFYHISKIHAFT